MSSSNLIITTGDITDADGFLALAEYTLNTDADILFIMNYPGYLYHDYNKQHDNTTDLYLGFNYGLQEFLSQKFKKEDGSYDDKYVNLLFGDDKSLKKQNFIHILTKITAYFCLTIFNQVKESKASKASSNQNLYFMIGGINKYNPFNSTNIKNEFNIYKNLILDERGIKSEITSIMNDFTSEMIRIPINSGAITLSNGKYIYCLTTTEQEFHVDFRDYSNVYVDGNGSISFFENKEKNNLFYKLTSDELGKIKGFYIMGGVLAKIPPYTASVFKDRLHRAAVATMNQIYSPEEFYNLMWYFNYKNIPLIFVPNHSILLSESIITQLNYLLSKSEVLNGICNAYYNEPTNGQQKPFDLIVAKLLIRHMNERIREQELNISNLSSVVYDKIYGATVLIPHTDNRELNSAATLSLSRPELLRTQLSTELPQTKSFKDKLLEYKVFEADKENLTQFSKLFSNTEYISNISLFDCYIASIEECDYTGGKTKKYVYSETTTPKIESYNVIINKYVVETTGGRRIRKIRRLKKYYLRE